MEKEHKDTLTLNIVQGDIKPADVQANLECYGQAIAAGPVADLWLLPETFATGFTAAVSPTGTKDATRILQWLADTAVARRTAVCGSILTDEGGKRYNRLYLADASGRIQHYDKRHLFSYGNEGRYVASGTERPLWDLHGWKIMPSVCYDLRFPVWLRNDSYYDLLICSANWPESRIAAWDTLLRARSIENMAYVAGANRVGTDAMGSLHTGHSAVLTPLGKLLTEEKPTGQTVLSATLSFSRILTLRQKYGFLEDRDIFRIDP